MTLVGTYETLAGLTRSMLEAAQSQDWDSLCRLGAEREPLLSSLPATLPPMPPPEAARIRELIEEMLACHAAMTERAGAWLDHVRPLLEALAPTDSAPPAA